MSSPRVPPRATSCRLIEFAAAAAAAVRRPLEPSFAAWVFPPPGMEVECRSGRARRVPQDGILLARRAAPNADKRLHALTHDKPASVDGGSGNLGRPGQPLETARCNRGALLQFRHAPSVN